ncbi:adenylate/guanylate cyclase domain-containing protein [Chryseolinea sp. H1M3-3]|uniref:adenylate/guanylate cyclase domain-containing protein n=1 Tax=Chryseolinea sp. H1M3-3 TaxID=3034144 RepID=UPI0023EB03BE|nr:adenylate/guanylate cyclase domain-containing protein [Chryseolinea sp. H1M3-3]
MAKRFEYTTLAQRYTARFPVLTYVGIQVNFWIIANILLVAIIYLQLQIIGQTFEIPVAKSFGPILLIAVILGIVYGVSLGLTSYYLDKKVFRRLSLGKVILFKALGSLAVLTVLVAFTRFVLFEPFISPSLYTQGITLNETSWEYTFYVLLIYYFFMTLVISFINQVNKKYGPGVLVPLLMGRYRNPREEERIFMFMDLKSSTTTAEKLGHLKYSSFIRDCFMDINDVLLPFHAQVYQYVGDEIVVTWTEDEGLKNLFCIKFYFACKKQFLKRAEYYRTNYGLLPDFKAGIHTGKVTAVEIGDVKRDIAFHGDTLNTASRIQSVCNEYEKSFLASEYLIQKIGLDDGIKTLPLGMILLKGKAEKIGLVSIESNELPAPFS